MFLIDGPYVSDYLKQTLTELKIPVIQTEQSEAYLAGLDIHFISEAAARKILKANPQEQIYTNSENALEWIYHHLADTDLAQTIQRVKDKILFRQTLVDLHPDYFFKGVRLQELHKIDPATLPFPLILKPAVGFFSLGVQSIKNEAAWNLHLASLDQTIKASEGLYPEGVLDHSAFIIEAVLEGDEFAIDCTFDAQGQVIILNMMKHLFASESDVNDRVYITSAKIMDQYLPPIQTYLDRLGARFKLRNFPAHIEIRIKANGEITPIEINPLRFGGWCSTPDLAQYAWDMNIYDCLVNKTWPDWSIKTQHNRETVYALVVLNNSTGTVGSKIKSFNYESLLEGVRTPFELRRTDFNAYPVFGFLMCSVPEDDFSELTTLLHSDLKAFITV